MGVVTFDLCGYSRNIIQLSCSVRFLNGKQCFKILGVYMEINF